MLRLGVGILAITNIGIRLGKQFCKEANSNFLLLTKAVPKETKFHKIGEVYKFNTLKSGQKKEISCIKFTGKEMLFVLQVFPIVLRR
jgi:hypothetical protein